MGAANKLDLFEKEYNELLKKYNVIPVGFPRFVPIGNGLFGTIVESSHMLKPVENKIITPDGKAKK